MTAETIKSPIIFGSRVENGLTIRVSSRDVITKAIDEGAHIQVSSEKDYINLFHVFERAIQKYPAAKRNQRLVRRRIGPSTWLVMVAPAKAKTADIPEVELEDGYDPKRGRYKRYAAELAGGGALTFADREEAVKARRAWQLYVQAEDRTGLRARIRKVPRTQKFLLCVVPVAG